MAKAKKQAKKVSKKQVKKSEKKAVKKEPGVIASILEFISDHPCSKERILEKLKKRFPDRDADGMAKTIQAQLPNRMSREKHVKIVKDKDGCFSIKK